MDRRAPRSRASAQVPRRCPDWNATSFSFAGHDPLAPDERRDMTRFHYAPAPGGERSTPRLPTGILRDRGGVASTPRLPTGIVRDQSGVGPATASPVASQMTMLRDPFRRLVSAFYHSKRRKVECPTLARGASVLDFARCRNETGPRGCATKMLVGRACEALGPASKRGSASTPAAVRRGSSVGLGVSNPRRSSSAGVSADRRTRAGGSLSFGGRGRAGQGPTRRVFLRRPQRRLDGQRLPGPFPLWKADVRSRRGPFP